MARNDHDDEWGDQSRPQWRLPPLTKLMSALIALYVGGWLLTLVVRTVSAPGTSSAFGWLDALVLTPSRVVEGKKVWTLLTHALLLDPTSVAAPIFNALVLWAVGGPMESEWGRKRLGLVALASTLLGAVLVTLAGVLYLPWWHAAVVGPVAFETAMIVGWGLSHRDDMMSAFGVVTVKGKTFAIGTTVIALLFAAMSRSPSGLMTLAGAAVAYAFVFYDDWRDKRSTPRVPPSRGERGRPKLRVIEGGKRNPRDLPN